MVWQVILLIVVALLTVPFILGNYIARKFRMPDYGWKIGLVLCTLASSIVIVWFSFQYGGGPKLGIDLSGGVIFVFEIDQSKKTEDTPLSKAEMDRLIAAVSKRVNPGGQKEITVRPYGVDQIEIIIPNVHEDEANRIKGDVSSAGTLEFRILANTRDHQTLIDRADPQGPKIIKGKDNEGNEVEFGRWVPVNPEQTASFDYPEIARRTRKVGDKEILEILVFKDDFDVTGQYLLQATPGIDRRGQPCVNFRFNTVGSHLFGGLTGSNLPDEVQKFSRKLGIILNGELYSAPAIRSTIFDRGEISGSFTDKEVESLVNVLNAGALPTALTKEPISQLLVGPMLGLDTIKRGSWSIAISITLVLLFMLLYYRFSGLVACFALLMNLVLILAIMISIKAAFSLAGLAGLVLTVGMAVDANVLIFERIREELARGAALRMAIRNGFSRATTTIVDANLTTLIVATVLWAIGQDQIKGFAVVLWLGVVMSMYTAIFCSRVIFDIAERRHWIKALKMMRIIGHTQIDFIAMARLAFALSLLVIVVGLAGVVARGKGLLDIDFTGGVSVEVLFKQPPQGGIAQVRSKLSDVLPDLAVSTVEIQGEKKGVRYVINTSQEDIRNESTGQIKQTAIHFVEQRLHEVFPGALETNSFKVHDLEEIKPTKQPTTEEPVEPVDPVKPDSAKHRRNDLPSDSLLAMAAAPPLLLAQAEQPREEPSSGDRPAGPSAPQAVPDMPSDETPALRPPVAPPTEPPTEPPAQPTPPSEPSEPTVPSQPAEPTAPTERPEPAVAGGYVGGTRAKLTFKQKVGHETVMDLFAKHYGSEAAVPAMELSNPGYEEQSATPFATWNVKIQLPPKQAKVVLEEIKRELEDTPHFPSSNVIGGKVAGSTRTLAVAALLVSLLCIVGYIWIRFQRVVFGLAAVIALVHDVLITLGVIALSAYVAPYLGFLLIDPFKISLAVLAAFLTIIGYSLNDTIVVFDRIREVKGKAPRLSGEMVNLSINQTLSRTLLTSLTTLLVVVVLYAGGGQGIHAFAFALVVGVLVGTYSSVFVASPVLLWMSRPPR